MEIHPATRQAEAGRAPQGDAPENRARPGALEAMLLALLTLLCRNLGRSVATPATGWTVPHLLRALGALIPTPCPRRRRTPDLRPFIPRRLRRGSPELFDVDDWWLPPRGSARLRRHRLAPSRPRQGRDPPACARMSPNPAPTPLPRRKAGAAHARP